MVATEQPDDGGVSRALAVRLIGALRQGSNCLEAVTLFSAGRRPILNAAERLMEDLTFSGGSAVRWLKGTYGSGKTHIFARLLDAAHLRGWIVSYIEITSKGQGCDLNRFEEVYAAIIRNCITPDQARSTDAVARPGAENGWQWILDRWVDALRKQAGGTAGGDLQTFRFTGVLDTTISQLRRTHGIQGAFSAALRAYAIAKVEHSAQQSELLLEWFSGVNVFGQSSQVRKELRAIGVLEVITRRNAKAMLRQVTAFARYRGHKGFLLLLDEVENVMHYTPGSRRIAYTILRELIDNVDERHGMAQTLVYLSGTPDLFEGEKGITEHEALASRVILTLSDPAPNPAAAVVDLGTFPISRADLIEIAQHIGMLYRTATPSANLDGALDGDRLGALLPTGQFPSPRIWVRQIVDLLDRAAADSANG